MWKRRTNFKLDNELKKFKNCIKDELRNNAQSLELKCEASKDSASKQPIFKKKISVKEIDENDTAKCCASSDLVFCGWELKWPNKLCDARQPELSSLYTCDSSKYSFELVERCGHSCLRNRSNSFCLSPAEDSCLAAAKKTVPSLYKTLTEHKGGILSLVELQDGRIASGDGRGAIKTWNVNEGREIRALTGHTDCVNSLVLLKDGRLVSGSADRTIKVWNLRDGSLIRSITGHAGKISSLVLLPDGKIASACWNGTIKIWNVNDGSLIRTLAGHEYAIDALVLLKGDRIASGAFDSTIKIWNVNDGSLIQRLSDWRIGIVYSLVLLKDGSLAGASDDKTIKIFDVNDWSLKTTLTGHTKYANALILLKDGRMASAGWDGTIKIWNV